MNKKILFLIAVIIILTLVLFFYPKTMLSMPSLGPSERCLCFGINGEIDMPPPGVYDGGRFQKCYGIAYNCISVN